MPNKFPHSLIIEQVLNGFIVRASGRSEHDCCTTSNAMYVFHTPAQLGDGIENLFTHGDILPRVLCEKVPISNISDVADDVPSCFMNAYEIRYRCAEFDISKSKVIIAPSLQLAWDRFKQKFPDETKITGIFICHYDVLSEAFNFPLNRGAS